MLVNKLLRSDQDAADSNALTSYRGSFPGHPRPLFSTILADTPALLKAAHALRFQVYCLERGFEDAAAHPDRLEKDAYDAQSVHGVLLHQPTLEPVGTVRAILPMAGETLPIGKLLQQNALHLSDYLVVAEAIEISRFAISKDFRKRGSDTADTALMVRDREGLNEPFLSLLQFVLRESIRHDVRYWTAVMELKLLRLLARMGICYSPIGPVVEHHGIRQPCYCYLPDMLEHARRAQPKSWQALTDGGALHEQLLGSSGDLAVA